jgi:phosphatidylglycerophosphate synthase
MKGNIKRLFRRLLDPVADGLKALGVTANMITLIGLVVSVVSAGLFAQGRVREAGLLLLLSGLCDVVDGTVARRTGSVSPFGAFLDSTVDRYADGVVLAGIAWHAAFVESNALIFAAALTALVGSYVVSYARARAEGLRLECTVGVMERPERVLTLAAGAVAGPHVLPYAVGILALGSQFTALQRVVYVWRTLRGRNTEALEPSRMSNGE